MGLKAQPSTAHPTRPWGILPSTVVSCLGIMFAFSTHNHSPHFKTTALHRKKLKWYEGERKPTVWSLHQHSPSRATIAMLLFLPSPVSDPREPGWARGDCPSVSFMLYVNTHLRRCEPALHVLSAYLKQLMSQLPVQLLHSQADRLLPAVGHCRLHFLVWINDDKLLKLEHGLHCGFSVTFWMPVSSSRHMKWSPESGSTPDKAHMEPLGWPASLWLAKSVRCLTHRHYATEPSKVPVFW